MIIGLRLKGLSSPIFKLIKMSPKVTSIKEENGNFYPQSTSSRIANTAHEESLLFNAETIGGGKRNLINAGIDDKPNKRAKNVKRGNVGNYEMMNPENLRAKNMSMQPIRGFEGTYSQSFTNEMAAFSTFAAVNFKTTGQKYVGAHTSVAGGLENSVYDAVKMGAKAFGLFLRSQRQWKCKPLEDAVAEKFINAYREHGFSPNFILPHGSYLLNCGSPNDETLKKSREALTDELRRCEKLGLLLYNFHPGSTCGEITIEECIDRIAESINQAHKATTYVVTVIENMSCQGYTIGGEFKELKQIIDKVYDKSRIGVCIDTCHAFASGYDLSTEEGFKATMEEFERDVGFHYLRAIHLNDSKGKLGCHLDRHETIGKGFIGIKGFERVMNEPRFNNIPMILETPWVGDDVNAKEIKLLYSLCKS